MNVVKYILCAYLILGVVAFAVVMFYVYQTRDRNETSAGFYYKWRAITDWRWRAVSMLGVFFYVVVLWLPLVFGVRVPPMPPLDGSK